jgi:hypothetical protein
MFDGTGVELGRLDIGGERSRLPISFPCIFWPLQKRNVVFKIESRISATEGWSREQGTKTGGGKEVRKGGGQRRSLGPTAVDGGSQQISCDV